MSADLPTTHVQVSRGGDVTTNENRTCNVAQWGKIGHVTGSTVSRYIGSPPTRGRSLGSGLEAAILVEAGTEAADPLKAEKRVGSERQAGGAEQVLEAETEGLPEAAEHAEVVLVWQEAASASPRPKRLLYIGRQ